MINYPNPLPSLDFQVSRISIVTLSILGKNIFVSRYDLSDFQKVLTIKNYLGGFFGKGAEYFLFIYHHKNQQRSY